MIASAEPTTIPVQRSGLVTRDIALAHARLGDRYVAHRLRLFGSLERFMCRQATVAVGQLSADRMRHAADIEVVTDPFGSFIGCVVDRGRISLSAGRDEYRPVPGDVYLNPPDRALTARWHDIDIRMVHLPTAEIARVAAARYGIDATAFRFTAMTAVSPAMAAHWRATTTFVHRILDPVDPVPANPLVHANVLETVAAAALAVFPNTAMTADHVTDGERPPPAAIHRAVAYIDRHAHEPITLADIAAAARIGVRSLQRGFRLHLDTTPMAYLRRTRLEGAHRELAEADPAGDDTVASVAPRWGWLDPERFVAEYEAEYGRRPERTDRR